jgi:rhamnulokinase
MPVHILPPLAAPGTVLGELRGEVMAGIAELGLGQPLPVIATGSHDTASAVAAVPGLDAHSAYISSGTWSLVGVEVAEPVINEQALALNFTNEGGVAGTVRLLKNVAGLWLLQESRRQWAREGRDYTWEELLALAEGATPLQGLVDPDAPDFLSPGDMPAALRAFCRRTGQPEPQDVGATVRCCLESLALKYRWALEALEALTGRRLEVVRVVGGGSQNRPLCQFTADACGRPVVAGPVEATALGNLMLQAIATGRLADVTAGREAIAASVERQRYDPRPSAAWEDAFGRFCELLEKGGAR